MYQPLSAQLPAREIWTHGTRLYAELLETVTMLVKDEPLPRRYFDHSLGGEWSDLRDRGDTGIPAPGAMRYSDPGIVPFGKLSQ